MGCTARVNDLCRCDCCPQLSNECLRWTVEAFRGCSPRYESSACEKRDMAQEILVLRTRVEKVESERDEAKAELLLRRSRFDRYIEENGQEFTDALKRAEAAEAKLAQRCECKFDKTGNQTSVCGTHELTAVRFLAHRIQELEAKLASSESGAAALRTAIKNASRPPRCTECGGTEVDCIIMFRCLDVSCGETMVAPSPEAHLPDVDAGLDYVHRGAICGRCGAVSGTHGRPCIDDDAFMVRVDTAQRANIDAAKEKP